MIYIAYDCEQRTPDVYLIEADDINAAVKAFMAAYNKHNNTVVGSYGVKHIDDHSCAWIDFSGQNIKVDAMMSTEGKPSFFGAGRVQIGKFNERFMKLFMRV